MIQLLDIRTHRTSVPDSVKGIVNTLADFEHIPSEGWYSAGLHPWYLKEEHAATQFEALKAAVLRPNVLAIGECGLDKACVTDFELQMKWFIRQIELASSLGKPLIIHCVRAFDETLALLRIHNKHSDVVFHGFNKSPQLAQQIVSEGHYLSFGEHLNTDKNAAALKNTAVDRLFLETDSSELPISSIYQLAAFSLGIEPEELSRQIAMNFSSVFGQTFPKS